MTFSGSQTTDSNTCHDGHVCLLQDLKKADALLQKQQQQIKHQQGQIVDLQQQLQTQRQRFAATVKQLHALRAAHKSVSAEALATALQKLLFTCYKESRTWNERARLAIAELRAATGISNKKLGPVVAAVSKYLTGLMPSPSLTPVASTRTVIIKKIAMAVRARAVSAMGKSVYTLYCDAASLHSLHVTAVMVSYFDVPSRQPRQILMDLVPIHSTSAEDEAKAVKETLPEHSLLHLPCMVSDNHSAQDLIAADLSDVVRQLRSALHQQQQSGPHDSHAVQGAEAIAGTPGQQQDAPSDDNWYDDPRTIPTWMV